MQELDDYIDRVQHLPPAPKILPQLLALLGREDIEASHVVDLMMYDPSLTAAALQLCNNAHFAGASPATDLNEAVARLGFNRIYQLVAAVSGSRALTPPQKGYGINEGELWKHSVTTAVAGQLMAKELGEDENLVFTCGLLHDIGKVVLAHSLEHIYSKMIEDVDKFQQSLLDTEKRLLGAQHAEVGGRLLARWKFPSNIVAAVWFHHDPRAAAQHERLAAFVYLANMIAYFIGHGFGHHAFAMRGRAEALDILGMKGDDLPRFMIQTYENFEVVNALLTAQV
jgi:putative nucleotidyltransferase with HDIG domain